MTHPIHRPHGGPRQVKQRLAKAGLTSREMQVYQYIKDYILVQKCGPSYREVGEFLNGENPERYRFRGQYYIRVLEEKGYIEMGRARRSGIRKTASMRLTDKKPEDALKGDNYDGQRLTQQGAENRNGVDQVA